MSIGHLLVPTDLSAAASYAYAHAATLAREFDARVTVLHSDELMVWSESEIEYAFATDDHRKFLELRRTEIEALFAGWGVEARFEVYKGLPRRVIPWAVTELGVDLVVMPRRSRSRLKWLLVGSTTERVLRTARVPVLVTVQRGEATDLRRYARVLVATNLGEESAAALKTVLPVLEAFNAAVTVLHVGRQPPVAPPRGWDMPMPVLSQGRAAFAEHLDGQLARFAAALGPAVERRLVIGRDPGSEIAELAAAEDVDLVVLASSGRSLRRLGSTAARVVQRSSAPVLVVPSPQPA